MSTWIVAVLVTLLIYFLLKKQNKWFYILYKTLPRDIRGGIMFSQVNLTLWWWEKNEETVSKLFTKLARKQPNKVIFYFEEEKWTAKQLDDFSNKVANCFKAEGYKKGDSIALMLENRPEYVGIWLGLSKIGVVTALINTNLVQSPLVHCLTISNAKALIFGSDYTNNINGVRDKIQNLKLYQFSTRVSLDVMDNVISLKNELEDHSTSAPPEMDSGTTRDKILYIYTSGTTGLPKAAVISNARFMFMVVGISKGVGLTTSDIIYDSLPLYHSAGGLAGAGQAILYGIPVVLRKKFSASNFFNDCIKYNCTAAQYIGEICRYLLATHKEGTVINHPVKKMYGNGLRSQIWKKFTDTFNVQICEFYGATEGNSNLINTDNTIGAVGFVPRYTGNIYPVTLIKCNQITGEPIRNQDGFCMRCKPNEPGILIGQINPKKAINEFTGYADKKSNAKKVIENVFRKGDLYFNSGDMLVQDKFGYYYFKDRTGDTFRWKGENVATNEIEAVISNVIDMKDCVVYGVKVPGTEGRAGMAAIIDPNNTLDKEKLFKSLKASLPVYAVPIFLRIMPEVPVTGTFKLKKNVLQEEAFDINKVKDLLYIYDTKNSTYVPLTEEIYDDIINGKFRL